MVDKYCAVHGIVLHSTNGIDGVSVSVTTSITGDGAGQDAVVFQLLHCFMSNILSSRCALSPPLPSGVHFSCPFVFYLLFVSFA